MEQRTAEGGKGARKAIAAQPAPADGAAKSASAPKGRGRRQAPSSEDPGEVKTALLNEGNGCYQGRKESAPRRRVTFREISATEAKNCDPAGKSDNPTEDKGALPKKQERHLKTKALDQEKAEIPPGVASPAQNHVPGEEEPDPENKAAPPRGKRASPKARPPTAQEPDPRGAEAVPRGRSLKQVLRTLVLRRPEVADAAEQVNMARDLTGKTISKKLMHLVQKVGTGSYYERVKINKPDEFDIMLIVPGVRVELEPYDDCDYKGAYYFVKLKRNPNLQQLNDFVDDQQRLSASRTLSALRSIISNEVKTINGRKVTMERKKPGSPAVTLQIGEPPSHISVDIILALEMLSKTLGDFRKGGPDLKKWLGVQELKNLDKMNVCLVPKNAKDGACFRDTWRLSFSLAEKYLIQHHGNAKTCCETHGKKCCRKDCLKLLKHLLEQLKTKHQNKNQFNKFCSYHAKTAFFHACTLWISDEKWDPTKLDECFERLLDYFLDCLRKVELKHFFIPECNLFSADFKCSILAKVIESERTNGYPILDQI